MPSDPCRIPLAEHSLFAVSIDEAVKAGGVEAAGALLELIKKTEGFLLDLRHEKVQFPKPYWNFREVLERHCAKMTRLWEAAKELPERLLYTRIGWEYYPETAKERISRGLLGQMHDYMAAFGKAQGIITSIHTSYKTHDVWGLLSDLKNIIMTNYAFELGAQRRPTEQPDCSDLKERWAKTLRPGRGKLKFADQERRRIFDEFVDRFRKAGEPVPTIRETCELIGGSKTTIHKYWEEARNRLRY